MIKSFVQGNVWHDESSGLVHRMPIISINMAEGGFFEREDSYWELINQRMYGISDWGGYPGKVLCQNYSTLEFHEYDFEKCGINSEVLFPACSSVYDNWYTVQIDHGRRGRPPRKVIDTELKNRVTGKLFLFEGQLKINYVNSSFIFCSHKHRDRTAHAVKIDSETGNIVWQNSQIGGCGERINDELFLIEDFSNEKLDLYCLGTGELQQSIPFVGKCTGLRDTIGAIRRYFFTNGQVLIYDMEKDDFSYLRVHGDNEEDGSEKTVSGDFFCATNAAEHRLRVYSIPEQKCIFEGYLPEIGVGLGTSSVVKLGDYYSFTVNDRSRWNHGFYTRTYLFTLDDLKTDSPEYDHEELKADYERVSREDGNVDYRVFFADVESYSVLYRHSNAIVMSIGQEYGWTKAFEGNSRDEQFTGKIIVDVSNQSLDDDQKNYLELLCAYLANELQLFYRAGMDPEQFITVTPQFE